MSEDRAAVLLEFVRSNLLADQRHALTAETPLVTERVVDSMGVVMLAAFVEERFGVRIDDGDLRAGELETITDILALIDRSR